MRLIVEDERHPRDSLPSGAVHLVNQDAGDGLVGNDLLRDLAILDGKIVPGGVQLESGGAFQFQGIIIPFIKRGKDSAGVPGGDGVHQGVIRCLTDLKNSVREALRLVRGVDLDDLHAAHALIVECEVLHLALFDENTLGAAVQDESVHGPGLSGGDGGAGGEAGDDRPTVLPGGVDAIVGANDGARAVRDQELHPGQRLVVGPRDEFLEDQRGLRPVVKIEGLRVIGVDHHRLSPGGLVDGVPWDRGRFSYDQ